MENIKSTVAKLNCGNTQGTAFLISKNFALTMSHCVQEAIDDNKKIYLSFKNIYGEDEIERIATILEYDNSVNLHFGWRHYILIRDICNCKYVQVTF